MHRHWDDVELSSDDELWAEMREFWSDEEDGAGGQNRAHWKRLRRGASGARRARVPGLPRSSGQGRAPRHAVITHYNAVTQVWRCASPASDSLLLGCFGPLVQIC